MALETVKNRDVQSLQTKVLQEIQGEMALNRVERTTFIHSIQQLTNMLANRKELDDEALPAFLNGVEEFFRETRQAITELNELMLRNIDRSQSLKTISKGNRLQFASQNFEELIEVLCQLTAHSQGVPYEMVFDNVCHKLTGMAFENGSTMISDLKDQTDNGIKKQIEIFQEMTNYMIQQYDITYITQLALTSIYLSHLSASTGIKPVANPLLIELLALIDRVSEKAKIE